MLLQAFSRKVWRRQRVASHASLCLGGSTKPLALPILSGRSSFLRIRTIRRYYYALKGASRPLTAKNCQVSLLQDLDANLKGLDIHRSKFQAGGSPAELPIAGVRLSDCHPISHPSSQSGYGCDHFRVKRVAKYLMHLR